MTGRDAKAMGALAESLIWPAIDLIGLVRGGSGDRDDIGALLSGLTDEERWALPVVLAAMVDHERTPDELLGWVSFDETGRPLRSPRTVTPRWRVQVGCGTVESLRRHDLLREDCEACTAAEAVRAGRGAARRERSRREAAA